MPAHIKPKIRLDRDVWSLALERVDRLYDRFDEVCVSFSGGKDSTATLHVALEVAQARGALPMRVVHFDEECIPYETEDYCRRVSRWPQVAFEWYCLPVKHRNACSRRHPWWWPWAPEARDLWTRPLPPEAITELEGFPVWPPERRLSIPHSNGLLAPPERGEVCMLLGIRAAESVTRERAVRWVAGEDNYVKQDREGDRAHGGTSRPNVWKAYPIYDWSTMDVWTAPARFGWDYNRAYDLLEMAGVSAFQQRCSPAFGEEPLQKLWTYATCFPDVWDRMTARVPGVGAAVRYAQTELYGFKGIPPKPEGLSWREFTLHFLDRHNDEGRRHARYQVDKWIKVHYGHTSDPILPRSPHPETGVSWRGLIVTAMRGDFKDRKQFMPSSPGSEARERARGRYEAERAQLTETGGIREC